MCRAGGQTAPSAPLEQPNPMGYCLSMSRVFVSEGTGAMVSIFAHDHCPPHVHAIQRADKWLARVGFSYLARDARLISITPLKNRPRRGILNLLLDEVENRLTECQRAWWLTRSDTCLANRWVKVSPGGKLLEFERRTPGAKQVAGAVYDPQTGQLDVHLQDGSRLMIVPEEA